MHLPSHSSEVSTAGSCWELWEEDLFQALALAWRWPASPCVSSRCLPSVCIPGSPFYKDSRHIGLRPILMLSLTWLPPQRPCLQIRSQSELLDVRTTTLVVRRTQFSPQWSLSAASDNLCLNLFRFAKWQYSIIPSLLTGSEFSLTNYFIILRVQLVQWRQDKCLMVSL